MRANRLLVPLHVAAVFLGAWQLFLVQPMAAKLLLPHLGGSPAVWNTCALVFQALLLAGYLYAHVLTRRLAPGAQVLAHAAVLALPFAALPVGLPGGWIDPGTGSPIAWTAGALILGFGAPFAALATTGPLLQRWFSTSGHVRARDPYFLYAASNAGSLGALAAYPLIVEPAFRLGAQRALWSAGYVLWALLVGACAWAARGARAESPAAAAPEPRARRREGAAADPAWRRIGRWMLLAFVPSSLMLGATQYLTTDVAVFPLLWIVPLASYLLSFVLVFSGRSTGTPRAWGFALAGLAAAAALSFWALNRPWVWLIVILHPLVVFAAGMMAHGRLAAERPEPARLTGFFLAIAAGGALGGVFNALVAPLVFPIVVEYPLVLVLACLLRPPPEPGVSSRAGARLLDLALPLGLGLAALGLEKLATAMRSESVFAVLAVQALVPCAVLLAFMRRPLRFALGLAALLAIGGFQTTLRGRLVHVERTFYGVHRVLEKPGPPFRETAADGTSRVFEVPFRRLYHGGTRHGQQALDERFRRIPSSYFHPTGPIGQVFRRCGAGGRLARVGVIGLGVGSLAAYAEPGRDFTFFELDPAVVRIARDPQMFTFLSEDAPSARFVVGDGRLQLAQEPPGSFDLIVVDAFSSAAIPAHLLTREALEIYRDRLAPGGLIALHVTNQNLDIGKVVDAIAATLALSGLAISDEIESAQELLEGKDASSWVVLAREPGALDPLRADPRWQRVPAGDAPPARRYVWTDDYSNVVSVLTAR
jgi:SAM-dependent methyltransferase